jgi:hypothetical protein
MQPANMVRVRVMASNPTFKNILVISWRLDLLVEETRVPAKITRFVATCEDGIQMKTIIALL